MIYVGIIRLARLLRHHLSDALFHMTGCASAFPVALYRSLPFSTCFFFSFVFEVPIPGCNHSLSSSLCWTLKGGELIPRGYCYFAKCKITGGFSQRKVRTYSRTMSCGNHKFLEYGTQTRTLRTGERHIFGHRLHLTDTQFDGDALDWTSSSVSVIFLVLHGFSETEDSPVV